MQDSAVAGACAGLASSVLTCPLDVVKTQLQAQGAYAAASRTGLAHAPPAAPSPGGLRTIVSQIWAHDGIRGFYHGLGPTMLGYLPTWAIYFTLYDHAKRRLIHDHLGLNVQLGGHVMSAMLAGVATTTISSPVWVVKTRFMLQALPRPTEVPYQNTLDAFVRIASSEGLPAFYKGLVPSLLGTVHVAVQFPLYDNLKKFFLQYHYAALDTPLPPKEILACSTLSKMVASCLTYPHEVLRTRLQMQHDPPPGAHTPTRHSAITPRLGLIALVKAIWKQEGFLGFYKGMGINLLRTLPNSAMTLLTYELIMQHLHTSRLGMEVS